MRGMGCISEHPHRIAFLIFTKHRQARVGWCVYPELFVPLENTQSGMDERCLDVVYDQFHFRCDKMPTLGRGSHAK